MGCGCVSNMASVTETDVINLLKRLNIDLNDFPDLSFDGICKEESLQDFLFWLCNSLDSDNTLTDEELVDHHALGSTGSFQESRIPERLPYNDDDLFDDVQTSLETLLQQNQAKLSRFRLLEEELYWKEREASAKYSEKRKALTDLVARDLKEDVEAEIEKTFKTCLNLQPYIPDVKSYSTAEENLNSILHNFHEINVVKVEKEIQDENDALKPHVENLVETLVKSEFEYSLSINRFNATQSWVQSSIGSFNPGSPRTKYENVSAVKDIECRKIVANKIMIEEANDLRRKICSYEYFIPVLSRNRDALIDGLLISMIEQAYVNNRMCKTEKLSRLLHSFIIDIDHESDHLEELIKEENILADVKNEKDSRFDDADFCSVASSIEDGTVMCSFVIEKLKQQHHFNREFREVVGLLLRYLRCGPTLRFYIIPIDLTHKLQASKRIEEQMKVKVRQMAGSYSQIKTEVMQNPERQEQLQWVRFLMGPNIGISLRHDDSSFFNATMKR